ncbi:HlyD family efflux transporter periplasmic adaptor subunit [Phenylobacterium sp.]|uniref:efflux RND transporter periplasmic adaptor subunit n=1 Tax=Phenylobacterium sp. TaxID=1871053 RepID=UPI0019CAE40D|nr:HlyD family efflux transporter periplasmic adaptor subunit [Phenylobacterium sp.]MBC7168284.1 HlyD family efflux transporter periplasmic adaptor subunit [Phenylobacterium sp.]
MRKQLVIAAAVLAVGAAGSAALVLLRQQPQAEEPAPRAPVVQTVRLEARTGPVVVTGSGVVRPRAEVALAAQVSGRAVYVSRDLVSGGRVAEGELLVRIDPTDYRNRVRQARAAVQQAEVELAQTQEEARLARREYERFQARESDRRDGPAGVDPDDYASRFVPPPGVSTTPQRQPPTVQPGGLLFREPQLQAGGLLFREPQLQAAQAGLDRARAQLEEAQIALARTEIRAPFDAVVRSKAIAVGGLVQPGQQLAQIYASDVLEVAVPLPDTTAILLPGLGGGETAPGSPAEAIIDYGAIDYAWAGRVDRLEGAVDERARTLTAVIQIPRPLTGARRVPGTGGAESGPDVQAGPPPALLPGQFAQVRIEGAAPGVHFALPRRAIGRGSQVWVVEDGRLRAVTARLIHTADDTALVQGGFAEGDRVVVNEISGAVEGMEVRLASAVEQDRRRPDDGS